MSKYYHYCADCKKGEQVDALPEDAVLFNRGEYGRNFHYKKCPICNGNNAAYVNIEGFEKDTTGYWQSMIEYYYDDHEQKVEDNK